MIAEPQNRESLSDAGAESSSSALTLLALYVVSQAAALRLIDVAPYGVFQHYLEWSDLRQAPVALSLLLLQTTVCLVLASRGSAGVLLAPVRFLGWLRLGVVLAVVGFSLAVPTRSVARSLGEVLLAGWISLVAVLNLVLVIRAVPHHMLATFRDRVTSRITIGESLGGPRPWDERLPWILSGLVVATGGVLSWFVFDGVPHIDDSIVYYFQAKMLAVGEIQVPAPPDPDSFGVTHMLIQGSNWYSKFFPGWPALLSIGVLAGLPWLVNPVLGGVAILLAYRLVLRLFDRGTANATILLLAASPWLLATSSEMMSHAASLVWALLALLAIEYQRGRSVGIWSLVAGVSLGALYLTRPFDAALLGAAAAAWAWGAGGSRLSLGALATIFVVSLGIAALMFGYNLALTGSATLPPFKLWADTLFGPGVDVFGFGPEVGIPMWRHMDPLPGHGFPDVVLNANKNFTLVNFELFGWATGSILLAVLACLLGPWRRADTIFFGVSFIVIVGHIFYWTSGGPDFGARYWYLMIVPLAVLTVRGGQMVRRRLATGTAVSLPGSRVGVAIALASATALCCVLPWRSVTKYKRYRDIGGEVRTLVREHSWNNALVFVRSPFRADYQAAFNFLSPRLEPRGPIFAFDAGPGHREAVVRRFPDRPIWIIGPKDTTHAGNLVVKSGPLPAGVAPVGTSYPYERVLQVVLPVKP